MKFDSDDEEGGDLVTKAADTIFHAVEDSAYQLLQIMQKKGNNCPPNHLYVMLNAAAAAIQIAAKIISTPSDMTYEEFMAWVEEPVDRTAILTASLLLSRCMLPTKDGVTFEFNPMNICAAIEATKKVTGSNDVSVLTKKMTEAAAKYASPAHFFDNTRDQFGDLGSHRTLN